MDYLFRENNIGEIFKWPKKADCKSVVFNFASSTLAFPTKLNNAKVAQLVEHHPSKVNVVSSSLIFRSISLVVQLVECLPVTQEVAGSSPV